jgi:hypothetical protein
MTDLNQHFYAKHVQPASYGTTAQTYPLNKQTSVMQGKRKIVEKTKTSIDFKMENKIAPIISTTSDRKALKVKRQKQVQMIDVKNNLESKPPSCPQCSKTFVCMTALNQHFYAKHVQPTSYGTTAQTYPLNKQTSVMQGKRKIVKNTNIPVNTSFCSSQISETYKSITSSNTYSTAEHTESMFGYTNLLHYHNFPSLEIRNRAKIEQYTTSSRDAPAPIGNSRLNASPTGYRFGWVPGPTEYRSGWMPGPTEYRSGWVPSPTEYRSGWVPSPTEYRSGWVPSPTEYRSGWVPSLTEHQSGWVPSLTEYRSGWVPSLTEHRPGWVPSPDVHQSGWVPSPTEYRSGWVPSPTEYRSGWVPSPTEHWPGWVPSPAEHQSGWVPSSTEYKFSALVLATTDICSMTIYHHSCEVQCDWALQPNWDRRLVGSMPSRSGTQSDWTGASVTSSVKSTFFCSRCSQEFTSATDRDKHSVAKHSHPVLCTTTETSNISHNQTNTMGKEIKSTETTNHLTSKSLSCSQCIKKFKSTVDLKLHLDAKHAESTSTTTINQACTGLSKIIDPPLSLDFLYENELLHQM